ncbi:hypothetical protein C8R43DRAFT_890453, partial [Mycena crocata]
HWNLPTEHFCSSIIRTIHSCKHPFTSMAHQLRDIAQLNQLSRTVPGGPIRKVGGVRRASEDGPAWELYSV